MSSLGRMDEYVKGGDERQHDASCSRAPGVMVFAFEDLTRGCDVDSLRMKHGVE